MYLEYSTFTWLHCSVADTIMAPSPCNRIIQIISYCQLLWARGRARGRLGLGVVARGRGRARGRARVRYSTIVHN